MAKFKVSINPDIIKTTKQLGCQAELLYDLQFEPGTPKTEQKALARREWEVRRELEKEATRLLKEWGF